MLIFCNVVRAILEIVFSCCGSLCMYDTKSDEKIEFTRCPKILLHRKSQVIFVPEWRILYNDIVTLITMKWQWSKILKTCTFFDWLGSPSWIKVFEKGYLVLCLKQIKISPTNVHVYVRANACVEHVTYAIKLRKMLYLVSFSKLNWPKNDSFKMQWIPNKCHSRTLSSSILHVSDSLLPCLCNNIAV